ncbi:MAG: tetratricopeptide repeat protein [Chitinophagaceae bacterium]|nr:tetratricopeptide repeat protein [Chitinophagaceae bacterium]
MQKFIYSLLLTLMLMPALAQKKVDQVIPNDDKRKVERARKLYNELKIFEGERILKELVRKHPNEAYYHEALVQMQRQVLRRIQEAGAAMDILNPRHIKDSMNAPDVYDTDTLYQDEAPVVSKIKEEKVNEAADTNGWNGLDRSPRKEKKSRKEKKEKKLDEEEEPVLQEAVVTIDSTLLNDEEGESGGIEVGGWQVKKPKDNGLKRQLKMLEEIAQIPYDMYLYDMLQNARSSTRLLDNVDSASRYMREFYVDTVDPDLEVNEEARTAYQSGLEDYYSDDIPAAAKWFEKAVKKDSLFFQAWLKLGDAYFMMNSDTLGFRAYRRATQLNVWRPEGYEKLSMAYYNLGKYKEAAASIIEAIMIYPQHHYFSVLERVVAKSGRLFNSQWIKREVFPATTSKVYEEIIAQEKTPWWHYQAAKQDVFSYFDTIGIVRPNEKTAERYLEVYAWKRMLNNTAADQFQFARAMDQLGFLDCYVLVSLFHQDLYGQYLDLMLRNSEKVRQYFYVLINWEDKKFDKVRKQIAAAAKTAENARKVKEVKDVKEVKEVKK